MKLLLGEGAVIKVYDPVAMGEIKKLMGDKISYAADPYEALDNVDAMALITEWPEFRMPDFEKMGKLMKQKIVFDGRNIFNPDEAKRSGFVYYGIGRR
jgi:UDPglucose 6-dehydrogenase